MISRQFALRLTCFAQQSPFIAGCGQKERRSAELKSQGEVQNVAQQRAADLANRYQQKQFNQTVTACSAGV